MKRLKISLIAMLSVMIIVLCGIMSYGIAGGEFCRNDRRQSYGNAQLVLEKEIPSDGIESISILYDRSSNDIYLYESETNAIIVREYSSTEMEEKELSAIKVDGESLEVRGAGRSYRSFGFYLFHSGGFYDRHYTEVYLPPSYQGELLMETTSGEIISEMDLVLKKNCNISSSSGDISFPSVDAANVSVDTASGYVKMENINTDVNGSAGEIRVRTSSGDVGLKELTGRTYIECSSGNVAVETIMGDTQLGTSSGDIEVGQITGETKTESSSGCLIIGRLTGDGQFETTSGDIEIAHMDGNAQAATTSGNVMMPEGSGNRMISTSSGDVRAEGTEGDFQVSTQSGYVQVNLEKGEGSIETTSGDVQLQLEELTGMLNVNTSSGYVGISLAAENEFEFMTDTTSGDIVTFFDDDLTFSSRRNHAQGVYGVNAQGNRIEIQTTSGNVRISK